MGGGGGMPGMGGGFPGPGGGGLPRNFPRGGGMPGGFFPGKKGRR